MFIAGYLNQSRWKVSLPLTTLIHILLCYFSIIYLWRLAEFVVFTRIHLSGWSVFAIVYYIVFLFLVWNDGAGETILWSPITFPEYIGIVRLLVLPYDIALF